MVQNSLMDSFFEGLFLMKDKEQLSEYIAAFINSASYLGYTEFNVKKLMTALRLLFPDPKSLDENLILNCLVLLSMSDVYYKTMDTKQVAYIEKMLDLLEERFSGKRVAHIEFNNTASDPKSGNNHLLMFSQSSSQSNWHWLLRQNQNRGEDVFQKHEDIAQVADQVHQYHEKLRAGIKFPKGLG